MKSTLQSTQLRIFGLCLALELASGAQAQSLEAGKKAYQECIACHAVEKGVNGIGPSLVGVVGSAAGVAEGFRFSGPMKRSAVIWTPDKLDQYVTDPQSVVPGTRMPYAGMTDVTMRAELIRYLTTLK